MLDNLKKELKVIIKGNQKYLLDCGNLNEKV